MESSFVVDINRNTEEEDGASSSPQIYSETRALLPGRHRFVLESETSNPTERTDEGEEVLDSEPVNPIEYEADCLVDIATVPKLKLILTEWENRFKASKLRIEKKSSRSINAKNELYQLIGFYSVFQGVVLTAVAQTSLIQCQQSWGPVSLSLLASIATIVSVYIKLKSYSQHMKALEEETADSKSLESRIVLLKKTGKNFEFPKPRVKREASKGLEPSYIVAVILGLILFSGITLASCFAILCHNRDPSPSSPPPA